MNHAKHIASSLEKFGIIVNSVTEIDYGHQIRLACGVIINVFNSGKVVVQGKLHPFRKTENLALLKDVLPPESKWPPSMVSNTVTKALVLDLDGFYVERQIIRLK